MTNETIPMNKCVHGGLYRVDARNFRLGVYNAQNGYFSGIRHKWGYVYLDKEFHWDVGPPHGTAKPIAFLGMYPNDDLHTEGPLFAYLKEQQEKIER